VVQAQSAESVREFYDHLADVYHLIYPDWHNAVRRQGAVLDRLIHSLLAQGPVRVLDCACGIGTQAIGLALRGHDVHATDISGASVDRARDEALSMGASITVGVADMRSLGTAVDGTFDVVLACDNSLPHLVSDEDLAAAGNAFAAKLRPGGLFIASTRDYERAVAARPASTLPSVFDEGRRVVFQVWDWAPDGKTYVIRLFILRATDGGWSVTEHATTYRALVRDEVEAILRDAGFGQIRWHTPAETGYFQPIVTARTS
jgi:glycine/sarcosine N-methyltransferase